MYRKSILGLTILTAAFLSAAAGRQQGRAAPAEINVPDEISYTVRSYREGAHPRAGQIGVAVAKEYLGTDKKLPVVVFIHGGGWAKGDKDQAAWQCIRYAQAGYAAVTVSYRLIDEAPFPACIQDVMEAIRYVKSLAAELPIDPDNIGLQGYSAGAHLALIAALVDDNKTFHSGAYPDYDSRVKCVVAVSAPTDFVERRKREGPLKPLSEKQNENGPFLESISPVHYIATGQVPILMLHGTADSLVPSFHYEHFLQKCEDKGVQSFKLIKHPEGGHMFFFKERKTYQPIMDRFFAEQLKGN